ncbi:hypothetical protein [Endozoicomonas lisbonensis]|uniref:Uncharacterized protein n=1 Tax=Endozoicomonas lisbonensis TaxID=3120522 RepID=A0ABV2SI95_9GAMM
MPISQFDLEPGDILLMHGVNSDATRELIHSHAAVVATTNEGGAGIPIVFDIIGTYGFQKIPMPRSRQLPYSVFRLKVRDIGFRVATTGYLWFGHSEVVTPNPKREATTIRGVYSRTSLVTAFLGSPNFGPKAAEYARKLCENHRNFPPDELQKSKAGLFSGVTCTYLPIALYQTILGVTGSEEFMAIDARKSLPKDLAKYLHSNKHWEFLGLCEKE